jgi:tetratricopeptide (TPR) repeat protein
VSADNEIINDFIIPAYHYKGNALYALKKYQGAVNCFTKIPDYHELALVANLYRGFCYERLKFSQLEHAESCYKKVLKLYPASDYRDKDIIKDMVQGALIKNLIHQDKNDELIRVYTEELGKQLDEPDSSGNTLLMYATIHNNKKLIENLLEKNCDPFKADKFGNSAVSIAFDERKEELAEEFFIKFSQLKFDSLEEGGFTRYIAPKMHGNELNEIFHNNQTSIDTCLDAVERYCECLGDTPDYLA